MADKTSLNTVYLVTGSSPVTLEIIIGAIGQTAKTIASIGKKIIVDDYKGSLPEKEIGNAEELDGRVLYINTIIADTSRDTNFTEMILRLRGGVTFREYVLNKEVKEEGDAQPYDCIIEFIKI